MVARPPEVELTRWNPYNGGYAGFVRTNLAALHESVGITDAWQLSLFMERIGLSYNAICDVSGGQRRMIYTVARDKEAWHMLSANPYSNGLCLTTPTEGYTRAEWLGPQVAKVEMAAWWLAVVCETEELDVIQCSYENIRDAVWNNCHVCGGITTHKDYTLATGDGTHVDPRNFPMDVCVEWAQAYAGYANWQNKAAYDPAPQPPKEAYQNMAIAPMYMPQTEGGWNHLSFPVEGGADSAMVEQLWFTMSSNFGDTDYAIILEGPSGTYHAPVWIREGYTLGTVNDPDTIKSGEQLSLEVPVAAQTLTVYYRNTTNAACSGYSFPHTLK